VPTSAAAIPNFRIMEIDVDDLLWKDDLVTEPPRIENGHFADRQEHVDLIARERHASLNLRAFAVP
jgi:hypothetical protein